MSQYIFNPNWYQQYIKTMQGGKKYLMVVGAVKAALEAGVLIGSSTRYEQTDTHIRVQVTVRALNRHLPDFDQLPPEAQIGTYDGIAENLLIPKQGDRSAKATFPLEDAETSALGRALAKIGFALDTMATAEEMELAAAKVSSGYEVKTKASKEQVAEIYSKLKANGVQTKDEANAAAQELYGTPVLKLTPEQASEWIAKLSVPF